MTDSARHPPPPSAPTIDAKLPPHATCLNASAPRSELLKLGAHQNSHQSRGRGKKAFGARSVEANKTRRPPDPPRHDPHHPGIVWST